MKKILGFSVAAIAVMIFLFVVAVLVADRRASSLLAARLAELRAAGEPASLSDLAPRQLPPGYNAADLIRSAQGKTGPSQIELVLQAADTPVYAPLHDYGQSPDAFVAQLVTTAQESRAAARVLRVQALAQLQEGQPDAALATCVALVRLARHLDREPGLNSYFVALSVRGMAIDAAAKVLYAGPVSAESRAALQREFEIEVKMSGSVECLRSERALGISQFQALQASTRAMPPWRFTHDLLDYLDWMSNEVQWEATPAYRLTEYSQWQRSAGPGALTQLLLPALQAQREAVDRVRASISALLVLNALQRHGAQGPDAPLWNELSLPADVMVDPFTGNPLVVRHSAAGWTVYSLGNNRIDDGGQVEYLDIGVTPPPMLVE